MLTAAGQTLPQQYIAGGQANRKNKFINNTLHELNRPPVLIRTLQNKSISKNFTSKGIKATKFGSLNQRSIRPSLHQEVQDMLMKGAIVVLGSKEDQFLISLFLAKKRDGGNSPAVNLKGFFCYRTSCYQGSKFTR